MNIRPLNDRVLVKCLEAQGVTSGGIIIPDNAKERPLEAMVIAVGDGSRDKDGARVPLTVKAGDRVLFQKYGGTEVKLKFDNADGYMMLREDDILGVIEDAT